MQQIHRGPVGKATDFVPRKKAAPKPKKGPDGELYRDRAKERRTGKEGDFAQAEKMLEVRPFPCPGEKTLLPTVFAC